MKILNVNATLDPITGGGTAERSTQLSRALAQRGIDCSVLSLDIGVDDQLRKQLHGVDLHTLTCLNRRFYIPKLSLRKISKLVKQADVIHMMGHWTLLNATVYFYARLHGKPYIICPAGALIIFGRSALIKKLYNAIVGKRILKNAHHAIAITQDELTYFNQYQVSSEKVTIIPNAIVPEHYHYQTADFFESLSLEKKPFILFLGRLNAIKGPDLLLQAFQEIASHYLDYQLIFAGSDDGMLDRLKLITQQANLQNRVHFIGYADRTLKAKALQAASLLVIPSRSEAMSIVVFEAGCTATPVVISDQCGMNHLQHLNAAKVTPASVEGLKQALLEALNNPSQMKDMAKVLQDYTLANFTWDTIVEDYLHVFGRFGHTNRRPGA